MKNYFFIYLFLFITNNELKSQNIPSKIEAFNILQEIITRKPIVDFRNKDFKAERTISINSFFFNRSYVWNYISLTSGSELIKLITLDDKKPTPLQEFDFKQGVEREIFLEKNHIASQMTVKKYYEIIKRALIKTVELSRDKKYAIIEFEGDLKDLNTPDFRPYKGMKFHAYYNLDKKNINKISFNSNKTVDLPEDPKLSLTSSNGHISFYHANDKTYVSDVHFLGKIRYYIINFSVLFKQKFNYNL